MACLVILVHMGHVFLHAGGRVAMGAVLSTPSLCSAPECGAAAAGARRSVSKIPAEPSVQESRGEQKHGASGAIGQLSAGFDVLRAAAAVVGRFWTGEDEWRGCEGGKQRRGLSSQVRLEYLRLSPAVVVTHY